MKKRLLYLALILLTFFLYSSIAQATPQVVLNGSTLSFDVSPTIENERTLVPLRAIFEALGANVSWDNSTQTVTATKENTEIKLIIGGQAYKNGQPVTLDVPAKIINDRTMVPLRFVSESLGCLVSWDDATQTITITTANGTSIVKVNFIDVGQADAIYISLPNHNDILIDGGNTGDGSTVVNYLKNHGMDDDIELLIATHPHEDHIGGLPAVYSAFKVNETIDSGKSADTVAYKNYYNAVENSGGIYEADNYQTFNFGNISLQILTGDGAWGELNDYSVVCRLVDGNVKFLFTGDLGGPSESALTGDIASQILKVGHHGSRTSTSASFLSMVEPVTAVISVGAGNTYGHPTLETLQRLQNEGSNIYRTDLNGNVVISTDGNSYTTDVERQSSAIPTSQVQPQTQSQVQPSSETSTGIFVGSVKSNKYHYPNCRYAQQIYSQNQIWFNSSAEAQAAGYAPCGVCKP